MLEIYLSQSQYKQILKRKQRLLTWIVHYQSSATVFLLQHNQNPQSQSPLHQQFLVFICSSCADLIICQNICFDTSRNLKPRNLKVEKLSLHPFDCTLNATEFNSLETAWNCLKLFFSFWTGAKGSVSGSGFSCFSQEWSAPWLHLFNDKCCDLTCDLCFIWYSKCFTLIFECIYIIFHISVSSVIWSVLSALYCHIHLAQAPRLSTSPKRGAILALAMQARKLLKILWSRFWAGWSQWISIILNEQ